MSEVVSTFDTCFSKVYFLLVDNFFTMLCWLLPFISMNQPEVYTYPFPLNPSSHLPPCPNPSRLSQSNRLSSFPLAIYFYLLSSETVQKNDPPRSPFDRHSQDSEPQPSCFLNLPK